MDYEDAKAIMWLGLAVLFGVGGLGLGYACWRVGRLLRGVEGDLHRTVDEIVPIMSKAGTSMDQVNRQLGKVDVMMDSAVDMTEALDVTVRTVTGAIGEPVRKASGAVAGAAEAVASFRTRMSAESAGPHPAGGSPMAPDASASNVPLDDAMDEDDEAPGDDASVGDRAEAGT